MYGKHYYPPHKGGKVGSNAISDTMIDTAKLISETKMVGRFGLTALWHPANYPDANLDELINGGYGLRVACNIEGTRYPFLFHESQVTRVDK